MDRRWCGREARANGRRCARQESRVGEAAKRIPETYREKHPSIPWRGLAAFRDVLIHQYAGVSIAEVWQIIDRDLSGLRDAILAILPPLEQLEKELAGDDEPAESE